MYGIMTQDGQLVVCHYGSNESYVLMKWERASIPVMMDSGYKIDCLLNLCTNVWNRYDLVVFRFTEEQEEALLIKRLKNGLSFLSLKLK